MNLRAITNRLPVFALWIAMLIWASSFVAFKIALAAFHPTIAVTLRMLTASLCFLAVFRWRNLPKWRGSDVRQMVLLALAEPCLYFAFESWALKYTTASQAGMVASTMPLLVAVAAIFILKERIRWRTGIGLVLAVVGVTWLSAGARVSEHAPNPMLGNLLEFGAMVCATVYTIIVKKLSARQPPLLITGLQSIGGLVFFGLLTGITAPPLPTALPLVPTLAVVYLGIAVSLVAYGLYNYAVSRIPASQASVFVNLIPVFTVIMGRLVLNERFELVQYAASALVLVGVFISRDRNTHDTSEYGQYAVRAVDA